MHTDIIDQDTGTARATLRTLQPLRDLHRLNAVFSGATGVATTAASGWVSGQIDLPRLVVLALGSGLVGWAALLVLLAAQPAQRLVSVSTIVATGDAAWVFGTVALLVVRRPTAIGTMLALATGAVVAVFSVVGFMRARRARGRSSTGRSSTGRTEILFRTVAVAAPPSAAWRMVLDADLYARLAPNLRTITVSPDECERTCTDTQGHSWTEAMQLDHDRRVQHITVDVAQHPMPLDQLHAIISVHDDPAGSRIDLAFMYVTQATFKGLVTSLALPVFGRRMLRPIATGWKHEATTRAPNTSAGPVGR